MKYTLTVIIIAFMSMQTIFGQEASQNQKQSFETRYNKRLIIIKATQDIIVGVVKQLKDIHFEKNKAAKELVAEAFVTLNEANEYKEKYLKYAKEKNWEAAYNFAEKYWQSQVRSADLLFRAKKILKTE
jgi:hypothetical protein